MIGEHTTPHQVLGISTTLSMYSAKLKLKTDNASYLRDPVRLREICKTISKNCAGPSWLRCRFYWLRACCTPDFAGATVYVGTLVITFFFWRVLRPADRHLKETGLRRHRCALLLGRVSPSTKGIKVKPNATATVAWVVDWFSLCDLCFRGPVQTIQSK